jgi:transposase-like protein
MMTEQLSKEIIRKARELVLCGKSKHSVAMELGISISTMYKHTKDIPSGKWFRRL